MMAEGLSPAASEIHQQKERTFSGDGTSRGGTKTEWWMVDDGWWIVDSG